MTEPTKNNPKTFPVYGVKAGALTLYFESREDRDAVASQLAPGAADDCVKFEIAVQAKAVTQ